MTENDGFCDHRQCDIFLRGHQVQAEERNREEEHLISLCSVKELKPAEKYGKYFE